MGIQSLWFIPPDEADLLTNISGGRPGYCFRLHQNPELLAQRKEWIDKLIELLSSDRISRFEYAEELAKNRDQMMPILKIWLGFWRDVMLRSRNNRSPITNIDYHDLIDHLVPEMDKNKIFQIVLSMDKIFYHLDHNVNPRLALEDFMLTLPFD